MNSLRLAFGAEEARVEGGGEGGGEVVDDGDKVTDDAVGVFAPHLVDARGAVIRDSLNDAGSIHINQSVRRYTAIANGKGAVFHDGLVCGKTAVDFIVNPQSLLSDAALGISRKTNRRLVFFRGFKVNDFGHGKIIYIKFTGNAFHIICDRKISGYSGRFPVNMHPFSCIGRLNKIIRIGNHYLILRPCRAVCGRGLDCELYRIRCACDIHIIGDDILFLCFQLCLHITGE